MCRGGVGWLLLPNVSVRVVQLLLGSWGIDATGSLEPLAVVVVMVMCRCSFVGVHGGNSIALR